MSFIRNNRKQLCRNIFAYYFKHCIIRDYYFNLAECANLQSIHQHYFSSFFERPVWHRRQSYFYWFLSKELNLILLSAVLCVISVLYSCVVLFYVSFYACTAWACHQRHYVLGCSVHLSVRSFMCLSVQILLPQYLMNGLNSFFKTDDDGEYPLAPTDDLIRFWRLKVKV